MTRDEARVPDDPIDVVTRRLRAARRVTVLTGAGVSAASGVPTFRGAGGLWRSYRAEDLATAEAFERDPELAWEWYDSRRMFVAAARPNPAHEVLARWTVRWPTFTVITQNVDDLHLQAGTARLVRLHGSLWELSCWRECGAPAWRDERVPIDPMPPRCLACGGLARPGVVWFGEALPVAEVERAVEACACDLFLSVGTSSLVYPAAGLVREAQFHGAYTVEINPEATPATAAVDIALAAPADVVLPLIDSRLPRPAKHRPAKLGPKDTAPSEAQ